MAVSYQDKLVKILEQDLSSDNFNYLEELIDHWPKIMEDLVGKWHQLVSHNSSFLKLSYSKKIN